MKFNICLKRHINFQAIKRRGQILIPSLLVIPSLLIFVFLLFETAKLSREKIRQQFAIDSAVFIQMGDYTNIFNRTAYVNGAFPYRLFKEVYGCTDASNYAKHTADKDPKCVWDMLYESGGIPKDINDNDPENPPPPAMKEGQPWEISYKDEGGRTDSDSPVESNDFIDTLWLTSNDQGTFYWINWSFITSVYQFYVEAYTIFGSIEAAQWTVFERITNNSLFLRQSYYFNANTPECSQNPKSCADKAVSYFKGINVANIFLRRIKKIGFHAKQEAGGTKAYEVHRTKDPMVMNDRGLFQTAGFDTKTLKKIGNGIDVYQTWNAPANYFNVDFNSVAACREVGKPCVHAKISSQCPEYAWTGENNCVWPKPTPKYQTRLYP